MRHRKIHRQSRSKFGWLKNINIYKYLSILLICLFIYLIPTVIKKLIRINKIECESQYNSCPQELELRIKNYELRDYKTVKQELEQILSQDIQIDNYIIQYKIPSTLKIDLVLKKSKYSIKDPAGMYFLIDKNGLILENTKETPLPFMISDNNALKVGDNISDKDFFALRIIEKVALVVTIQSSVLEKNELIILSQDNKLIRFPLEGDVDVLVGSLRLIFSRLNEEIQGIKMVREIDLRFANPVLR